MHCQRHQNGFLKLVGLWIDIRVAHSNLCNLMKEFLKKNPSLSPQVLNVKSGRREDRGYFASEEVARKLARFIPRTRLWHANSQPVQRLSYENVTGADPESFPETKPENQSGATSVPQSEAVTGPEDEELLTSEDEDATNPPNISSQLSAILGHPVNFRLRTTPSREVSLIDVTVIFTGLNNNPAGLAVRRLLDTYPEFHSSIMKFKFPGRGRQTVDVAPLAVALEFAFLLPGKAAAQVRSQAASLMVRYLGGDTSLVEEVYANRRMQASLAAVPEEQRTPEQQVLRMCGEAVEAETQTGPSEGSVVVPCKPLVIQDEESVGLPGSDHLYAASRQGDNLIKIGVSKDVLQRIGQLAQQFGGQYQLVAVWPNEAVLESIVLDLLKPAKASLGTSREHFNANASFEQICQIVSAARNLYKMKMELEAVGSKRKVDEREFQEDMADRAVKRRKEEVQLKREEMQIRKDEIQLRMDEVNTLLLHDLVKAGDEEARRIFLETFRSVTT